MNEGRKVNKKLCNIETKNRSAHPLGLLGKPWRHIWLILRQNHNYYMVISTICHKILALVPKKSVQSDAWAGMSAHPNV